MDGNQAESSRGKDIIFYDGVCGLCNGFVKFVLANTINTPFVFASLQSQFAKESLKTFDIDASDLNSVSVITSHQKENSTALQKSDAVVYILKQMKAPYPVLGTIVSFIPRFIRDFGYSSIAKIRYKIFGKLEACMLPSAEEAEKFIEV